MPAVRNRLRWSLAVAGLLVAIILVVAATSPVGAAPPPKSLCGVCGDSLDGATADGTLDVHVDENGDSRWIARVPVDADAVDRYRTNATRLERAVDDAWYSPDIALADATDVETRVEDETVVVDYSVADVAQDGIGDARLIEYFYLGGSKHRYELRAESVTVHVPDDFVVTSAPANADVDGRTVTWTQERAGGIGGVPSTTSVTYAEAGLAGKLASTATVVRAYGPTVVEDGAEAATAPAVLLVLSTSVMAITARRGVGRPGFVRRFSRRLGIAAVGGGIVDRLLGWRVGNRGLVAVASAGAAIVGLVGWITVGNHAFAEPAAFTLGVALFVPFGYALQTRARAWPIALGISLTPAIPIVAYAPYASPWLVGILFAFWALAMVLAGIPFVLVGRSYGRAVTDEGN